MPLGAWLAELPDERLIRLLELRPDLAQPTPGSISRVGRARRVAAVGQSRRRRPGLPSPGRAGRPADAGADESAVEAGEVLSLLGERAPDWAVCSALDDLRERALVWGDEEIRVSTEAGGAAPGIRAGCRRGSPALRRRTVRGDRGLDEPARDVLERLGTGSRWAAPAMPPRHTGRPTGPAIAGRRIAAPGGRGDGGAPAMWVSGCADRRRGRLGSLRRRRHVRHRGRWDVDASAAGAALEPIRQVETVLDSSRSATPVPELRSGGLGVREAKRLAKSTGIDEPRLGLILELVAAAGLIASGFLTPPRPGTPRATGPRRWPPIASWRHRRRPVGYAIGHRLAGPALTPRADRPTRTGRQTLCCAVGFALFHRRPLDRRLLLELLAELPVGTGSDAAHASAALIWHRPRWVARLQPEPVGHLLVEAHAVGLTGRDALSSPGAPCWPTARRPRSSR